MAEPSSLNKLTVSAKAIVAFDADLRGSVSVGALSVIHPRASIIALQGPITIGEGTIVEEMAVIVNQRTETLRIGDYNHFEVGCRAS